MPIRQKLRPVNPQRAAAIRAKVEKPLQVGFIYPFPLTQWVSNLVLVDKMKRKISIDQIVDECAGNEFFCSWMDSLVTIRFQFVQRTSIRRLLFFPGACLHTIRCLLVLKMLKLCFSRCWLIEP